MLKSDMRLGFEACSLSRLSVGCRPEPCVPLAREHASALLDPRELQNISSFLSCISSFARLEETY